MLYNRCISKFKIRKCKVAIENTRYFTTQSNNIDLSSFNISNQIKAYNNILVVVKQTPFELYSQLKAQGKAPVALRWERLKNRFDTHRKCVDLVVEILKKLNINYQIVRRDELHRGCLHDKDLIICVGGDGTVLNTSSFVDDSIPILGVNSDPTKPEERGVTNVKDERRSRGALCALTSYEIEQSLPELLYGLKSPGLRSRIQCLIRSTYTETRLPPSLNDILIAHPSPAAVSRFRLTLCKGNVVPSYMTNVINQELFSFNVWSSGIWISTATGSTAAMFSAKGKIMDIKSSNLQYMVREHLVEEGSSYQEKAGHGFIRPNEMLHLRWNSQVGCAYVDGSHMTHSLELGDEIKIDGQAPYLQLFEKHY